MQMTKPGPAITKFANCHPTKFNIMCPEHPIYGLVVILLRPTEEHQFPLVLFQHQIARAKQWTTLPFCSKEKYLILIVMIEISQVPLTDNVFLLIWPFINHDVHLWQWHYKNKLPSNVCDAHVFLQCALQCVPFILRNSVFLMCMCLCERDRV